MKKKYPWIEQERHLFGNENAGYGFNKSDFNANEVNRRVERLKSTKASLAKTVNMRANIMLSDKEKESQELSRKRLIIATDRKKLIEYMDEVDNKKKDALNEAWKKINTDFGSIFSTFLPNSNARLVAPEGKTVLDGLEVKVAFGDVWKESLTELSGGQRSLVALSLILALLKFNPAPLYILDEVDAALDQSHTQNTGIMIRKHFRNSQVLNSFIFVILLLILLIFVLVCNRFTQRRYV
jgi:structural maintenance of chromosome 2